MPALPSPMILHCHRHCHHVVLTRFRESVLLPRDNNELTIPQNKFVEGVDYDFQVHICKGLLFYPRDHWNLHPISCTLFAIPQVVAVLNQPAPIEPRKSTYPQWVKSDPVRHKVKALPLLRTTTTKIGIIGPTPSRFPAQRTSLVGNRVEPTSLLPWLGIEPRPNESGRKYFIKKWQLCFRSQRTLSVRARNVCGVHNADGNRRQQKTSVRGNRGQRDVETGLNFPRCDSPPPPPRLLLNWRVLKIWSN